MPAALLKAYQSGTTLHWHDLRPSFEALHAQNGQVLEPGGQNMEVKGNYSVLGLDALVALAQWGDMIVLDYLTGNYDRVASMQDGAEKENKPQIIEDSIRNLRESYSIPHKLWFIDNESGLLDAYHLLYMSLQDGQRFRRFHMSMLRTLCMFQQSVVTNLKRLESTGNPREALEKLTMEKEPLFVELGIDESYPLFQRHFGERVRDVLDWVQECEIGQRIS